MSRTGYQTLPTSFKLVESSLRSIALAVNNLFAGKQNNVLDVTLAAGAASTLIQSDRIGAYSHFSFGALTANAAAIQASIYVTGKGAGMATVNHTNTANADQQFTVEITG